MTYDAEQNPVRLLTPALSGAAWRAERIKALGLTLEQDEFLDGFARQVVAMAAERFGEGTTPVAFVNLITDSQFASGLSLVGEAAKSKEFREAPPETGYCPHVVARSPKGLVLDDVCDFPRFAGNPIIDRLGVRTYVGAPLVDSTGTAIGTVCVVDRDPRPWGRPGLNFIKDQAATLMQQLQQRAAVLP